MIQYGNSIIAASAAGGFRWFGMGKSLSFVGALVAEIIYVVVSIVGCLAIVIYATWLLVERLRAKDKPPRSFGQWLKHVFEGVMGL